MPLLLAGGLFVMQLQHRVVNYAEGNINVLELLVVKYGLQSFASIIERTETLRVTGSQLLISFQKPHKAVSRDTISRWISTAMQLSGINLDLYKAHSTSAASVSAAHRAQFPIQEILSKAGWSSAQTFAIYCDKNLDTLESSASQFQEAILTL